ncbi:MAG: DUF402 domain-containing protein [Thermomicrobiales bacterium]|nr:DUF402 domain-containing protein [Thermomicrobiales bacterium]
MDSPLRPADRLTWANLAPGTEIEIVKLAPGGDEVTRYPGIIRAAPQNSEEWIVAEASWTRASLHVGELLFATGDRLLEYFSPSHPYDAFAVFSPAGELRGWYANVTWPSWMDLDGHQPVLYWHDLYVDLIALPDGSYTVMDEDELAAADVSPALRAMIEAARDELVQCFDTGQPPFTERDPL